MKFVLMFIVVGVISTAAFARGGGHSRAGSSHSSSTGGSHSVKGYTKKNGTHVTPSHATNRDGSKLNNWSRKGNVNPHTGKKGTKSD